MEVENKLDEDFLFYVGFTNSFMHRLPDKEDVDRCNAWLQKLCGEACVGVDRKRDRNIYLSNLVLCMQDGRLSEPFTRIPNEVDISNAQQVFGPVQPEVQEPDWLEEIVQAADEDTGESRRDGRTYLATRTLPGGEGAFAYIAVTLADDEPRWLGGGEGSFDRHMEAKYREYVPPVYEMEQILAKRKDPKERERVLVFYDALAQNISDELDGRIAPEENDAINGLLDQLVNDLRSKGEYEPYQNLHDRNRRAELLILLFDRIKSRRDKVAKREEILDDIEEKLLPQSFFETSLQMQDKFELPAAMWEQAINKQPNKKNMNLLQEHYPLSLIERFLELLSNHKEEIAIRMQKRHECIVSQMKKELRKEGETGRKWLDDAQRASDQATVLLTAVRQARDKQAASERVIFEKKQAAVSQTTRLYEELRHALYDTQKSVEEEAERGRALSAQINAVNQQTETYQQVTDGSIRKTEEVNIALMKNIKRLRNAIVQNEARLTQIQVTAQASTTQAKAGTQQFFIF